MKPTVAIHKFSSCDGCQLAFLNMGEPLIDLAQKVEIVHFAEAGMVNPEAEVDIAFVEGSIYTPEDQQRIKTIRQRSGLLITLGGCATSGGIQALRNQTREHWCDALYPSPEWIQTLSTSTPIADHVRVDLELWGCPVRTEQLIPLLTDLLRGVKPTLVDEPLCQSCKRSGAACLLVTAGKPCMGSITRGGCGAICPRYGRACYGCSGPVAAPNTAPLKSRFSALGLSPEAVERHFSMLHSGAKPFLSEGVKDE
ncbi:MAG: sulfhydrogenase subunit delta [Gammaproteobacteria bacterium]|jgi:sulfhydrogenase subunit delta|nr:sulfhydrogenase subunit delta [Gammaproteobacteria bacterium]MBT7307502.1 sulfhydrogenase subunit delta [Gammaproteobacteria bacterium]